MQEGLKHESPTVSGAADYQNLCQAAKAEEKRLAELKKRRQYLFEQKQKYTHSTKSEGSKNRQPTNEQSDDGNGRKNSLIRCWKCQKTGHIAVDCKEPKRGKSERPTKGGKTQQVQSSEPSAGDQKQPSPTQTTPKACDDPQQYLLSDSDGEEPVVPADAGVNEVRVQDKGSRPQSVRVVVAGVPVEGIVDMAADITIVGAEVFKRIAVVTKLSKRELKPADKTPRTYDHKIFRLDGRLDLDVTFQGKTMKTSIYLKMDAKESLLLSEGVCRQLGIVSYHPQVTPGGNHSKEKITSDVLVPAVRVQLVETVKLKPRESIMAGVRWAGTVVRAGVHAA